MTAIPYIGGLLAIAYSLSGCAQDAPVPVQPVSIKSSDFCSIMKRIAPPTGKPTWSIHDTQETIKGNRRVGAAVDARCSKPKTTS